MTIIVETNPETFKRILSEEVTFIVHKFNKPIAVTDTIIFQEVMASGKHTGEELSYIVSQIETDGCKAGYSAVSFKEKPPTD